MQKQSQPVCHIATAAGLCQDGAEALEAGNVRQAERLYRQATEAAPTDPTPRVGLAESLWKCGARADAVAEIETACHHQPEDAKAAYRAGEMQLSQGNATRAVMWANQAIGHGVSCPKAWALRGRAHAQLGDEERALADLLQAQRLDPNDESLQLEIARLHQSRGDHRGCLTALRGVLECECPEQRTEALAMAGQSCLAVGQPREALENLTLAAAQGGEGPDVMGRIADSEQFHPQTPKPGVLLQEPRMAAEPSGLVR